MDRKLRYYLRPKKSRPLFVLKKRERCRKNRNKQQEKKNILLTVQLVKSKLIENLIEQQNPYLPPTQNVDVGKDSLSNTVNNPEVFIHSNSPDIDVTMHARNQELSPFVPTFENISQPVDERREMGKKRPWKRSNLDWMETIHRITSYNKLFSNAVLGNPDLPNSLICNSSPSPKKLKPLRLKRDRSSISGASSPEKSYKSNLSCDSSMDLEEIISSFLKSQEKSTEISVIQQKNICEQTPQTEGNQCKSNYSQMANLKLSPVQISKVNEDKVLGKREELVLRTQQLKHRRILFNNSPILGRTDMANTNMVNTNMVHSNTINRNMVKKHCLVQSSPESISPKQTPTFKVPLPPKRPPGRLQQNKVISNIDLRMKLQEKAKCVEEDDEDAISLFAESLISESSQLDTLDRPTSPPAIEIIPNSSNSVSKCSEHIEQPVNILPVNPRVTEWISNISASVDPYSLQGTCYTFLDKGMCRRKNCLFKHELPNLGNNCDGLSETEFLQIFNRFATFRYVLQTCFDFFITYIKDKKRSDLLLNLTPFVMRITSDKTPFIKKTILALREMGFTFQEAISKILVVTRRNECLLDILLLFAVEEDDCLQHNWNVVNDLISCRQKALDFGVVQDIFNKCLGCDPPDQAFCENIYRDLIVKNNFNLYNIDRGVVLKYISLLLSFKLESFALNIMTRYNIRKEEISGVCTPQKSFSPASLSSSESLEESPESPKSPTEEFFDQIDFEHIENSPMSTLLSKLNEVPERDPTPIDFSIQETYAPIYHSNYNRSDVANYLDNIRSDNDSGHSSQKWCSTLEVTSPNVTDQQTYIPTVRNRKTSFTSTQKAVIPETNDEISDDEIIVLIDALHNLNWANLLWLIKKYSEPERAARNLIIQILAAIKSLTVNELCSLITKIFYFLGEYSKTDSQLMNMLKFLAANLIPVLDKEHQYKTIGDILNVFAKDYNFFVKYDIIRTYEHLGSVELKYVFLFKILSRCGKFKEAIRLLKHPESKLVRTFFNDTDSKDEVKAYKLRVLGEFVKVNIETNLSDAKDLIVFLMLNTNIEQWEDLKMYVNILMTSMLKDYSVHKLDIINMLDIVLNCWYKYLKPSVLRAFLINLYPDVCQKKILELFYLCIDIGVYPAHEGIENSISIPSDLLQEEIYLLIHHLLLKICGSQFPISSIVIKVEEPLEKDEYSQLHTVLISSEAPSTTDMIRRILNVLIKIRNFPDVDTLDVSSRYIVLPYNHIFLQPYQKAAKDGHTPPLIKFR